MKSFLILIMSLAAVAGVVALVVQRLSSPEGRAQQHASPPSAVAVSTQPPPEQPSVPAALPSSAEDTGAMPPKKDGWGSKARAHNADYVQREAGVLARTKKRTTARKAPATSYNHSSGPSCKKGCRCGNACISCNKTCRK